MINFDNYFHTAKPPSIARECTGSFAFTLSPGLLHFFVMPASPIESLPTSALDFNFGVTAHAASDS